MTPLGHVGIALLVSEGVVKTFPALDRKIVLTAMLVGGVAPDIDLLYRFYQKGLSVFDKTIGQHRFFPTHTPFFTFIVSLPLLAINFYFGLSFFIGTLVHLILDTLFFPEGINFGYPFEKKMTKFLTIKTHKFFAPKPISQVTGWWKNYLTSPLFWISEVVPTFIAFVILLPQLKTV